MNVFDNSKKAKYLHHVIYCVGVVQLRGAVRNMYKAKIK